MHEKNDSYPSAIAKSAVSSCLLNFVSCAVRVSQNWNHKILEREREREREREDLKANNISIEGSEQFVEGAEL